MVDARLVEENRLSIATVVHHVVGRGACQQAYGVQWLFACRCGPNAIHTGYVQHLLVGSTKVDFRTLWVAPVAADVPSGHGDNATRVFYRAEPRPLRRFFNRRVAVVERGMR